MNVEYELAGDLAKRAAIVGPAVVAVSALIWGIDGGASAAVAVVIVVANLLASAALLAWAAPKGGNMLMGVALGGFLLRMGVVTFAIWAVKDAAWVELVPLAVAVLAAQLGVLFWEARYVSASLAYPGLKPKGA